MSWVEIVKWRGGYYVTCAGHVWVGFREETEARRFVERKLMMPAAVVVYREDGGPPPHDARDGGR